MRSVHEAVTCKPCRPAPARGLNQLESPAQSVSPTPHLLNLPNLLLCDRTKEQSAFTTTKHEHPRSRCQRIQIHLPVSTFPCLEREIGQHFGQTCMQVIDPYIQLQACRCNTVYQLSPFTPLFLYLSILSD